MQTQTIDERDTYDLMKPDLNKSLIHNHIEPSTLSPFQRILLTTDGTLTEILEAYLFEPIQVVKLTEKITERKQEILPLDLKIESELIKRKVLLRGKISRRNLVYAESILVSERLKPEFRDELLKSQTPIGRLWLEHKIETFKEIVDSGKEPANELSNYFQIEKGDKVLFRTYCVFSNRLPIMIITEKFPESYYVKTF
jgi:chorismate-pyruvate lyase